ncbi:hypothetical protein Pmani_014462 [Petrolisthes manimaculis]|uniref:Uncharacterized protein n=1 Tax=Petrolisthes manimaculis TaxID=1843537 RepID=A0AAE1PTH5_9EUCA|nr:hypothetical protein Pmani_014462 [Petrolisthes manimaculis]
MGVSNYIYNKRDQNPYKRQSRHKHRRHWDKPQIRKMSYTGRINNYILFIIDKERTGRRIFRRNRSKDGSFVLDEASFLLSPVSLSPHPIPLKPDMRRRCKGAPETAFCFVRMEKEMDGAEEGEGKGSQEEEKGIEREGKGIEREGKGTDRERKRAEREKGIEREGKGGEKRGREVRRGEWELN